MPLHSTDPAPERILAFGPAGSGKTTNILNVARFSQITKAPTKFYVVDTDFAMDRMMAGYPEIRFSIFGDSNFQDPDARLTIYPCFEWRDYSRSLADIQMQARPGDWVAVDFIGTAWTAVQEEYVNEVFHKDIAEYFLQVRKEMTKGDKTFTALEGWIDWPVVNAMYRKWANRLLFRGRYHLYATAKSDNLSSERKPIEDAPFRALFARFQVKPVGQKELPFVFHTVLLSGREGDKRTLTAVKDRERAEVVGLEIKNFTTDYLVNVAGFKLA